MQDKQPLDAADLLRYGQRGVYYQYKEQGILFGPFRVVKTYRDHEGAKVLLADTRGNARTVSLADDEDYGAISFYTSND